MSHFLVMVLVPEDCECIHDKVDELLAPYSQYYEVAPYKEYCRCFHDLYEQCKLQMGYEEKINALKQINGTSSWSLQKSEDIRIRLKYQFQKLLSQHPFYPNADPHCEVCRGKGEYFTTRNQQGYFDYYTIGGRWDGWIYDGPDCKAQEKCDKSINVRPLKEIPFDDDYYIPNTVVTPDGEWTSAGIYMWTRVPEDEWTETTRHILSLYKNCIAVAVDCHI